MSFNPRMSKRETERLLKRMGVSMDELDGVQEVKILTTSKIISIKNPQVLRLVTSGTPVFQVTGEVYEEENKEVTPSVTQVSEDDVIFIAHQTNRSIDEARKALYEANGDLAKAILLLKS